MNESIMLLQQAADEIKLLRQQNHNMAARLKMFDDIMLVLGTPPPWTAKPKERDLLDEIKNHVLNAHHIDLK